MAFEDGLPDNIKVIDTGTKAHQEYGVNTEGNNVLAESLRCRFSRLIDDDSLQQPEGKTKWTRWRILIEVTAVLNETTPEIYTLQNLLSGKFYQVTEVVIKRRQSFPHHVSVIAWEK
jgi:hypothetical protein